MADKKGDPITPKQTQLDQNLARVVQRAGQAKAAAAATERSDAESTSKGGDADKDGGAPTISREEAVQQLKDAGFFDRLIIGREPESLTTDDLRDLIEELGRRTVVADISGRDVKDVKDSDFADLLRDVKDRTVEEVLGKKVSELSPLERLVVEQRFRDPDGVKASTPFADVVEKIAEGKQPGQSGSGSGAAGKDPVPEVKLRIPDGSKAGEGTERGDSKSDADDSADEDVRSVNRDEVVQQLKDAGFFDRKIIGREPENLTDDDLNDLVAELGRRTLVSDVTGKPVTDVKDTDFGELINDAQGRTLEDILDTKVSDLSPLENLIVQQRLRDPSGVPANTEFADLVDQLAGGRQPGTQTSPGKSEPGASGVRDQFLGGAGTARAGSGTERDSGSSGGSSGAGSGSGTDSGDDPFGNAGDPFGTDDSSDPASGAAGGSGQGSSAGGGSGDGGGSGTVTTVFQSSTGTAEADPSNPDFTEGNVTTFYRTDDGRWFDEGGHEVTDPAHKAELEAGYDEFQDAGGTDTEGTLDTTDTTFEEEQANQDPPPDDGSDSGSDSGTDSGSDDSGSGDSGDSGSGESGTDSGGSDSGGSDSGGSDSSDEDAAGGGVGQQEGDPSDPDSGGTDFLGRHPGFRFLPDHLTQPGSVPIGGSNPDNTDPADDASPVAASGSVAVRVLPGVVDPAGPDDDFGGGAGHGPVPSGSVGGPDPNVTDPLEGDFGSGGPPKNDDPLQSGPSVHPTVPVGSSASSDTEDTDDDGGSTNALLHASIAGFHESAAQSALRDALATHRLATTEDDDSTDADGL